MLSILHYSPSPNIQVFSLLLLFANIYEHLAFFSLLGRLTVSHARHFHKNEGKNPRVKLHEGGSPGSCFRRRMEAEIEAYLITIFNQDAAKLASSAIVLHRRRAPRISVSFSICRAFLAAISNMPVVCYPLEQHWLSVPVHAGWRLICWHRLRYQKCAAQCSCL